jgi:hypothetical protein
LDVSSLAGLGQHEGGEEAGHGDEAGQVVGIFERLGGIMVSASMARIAPAATAVVAAITSAEKWLKTPKPSMAARPETTAMVPHTPKT